jgi:serine/threonine-protein phosphatase 2A regulatory subunit B'
LLLNSEAIQKVVKTNMARAYPIIVQGLLNGSQQQHWNQTVTTITYQVIRSYMEMNRDQFEKLTVAAQADQKQKAQR